MAGAVPLRQTPGNAGIEELFDEWLQRVEKDVLELLRKERSMSASEIGATLKLSERAVLSVINRMAQQSTIRITGIQVTT